MVNNVSEALGVGHGTGSYLVPLRHRKCRRRLEAFGQHQSKASKYDD